MTSRFRVELLSRKYDRNLFDCGVASLNFYLQKQAGQEAKRRIAVTYLMIDQEKNRISGYFTLSSTSVIPGDLPSEIANRLPRYESIPATLTGRLALDRDDQGKGLGKVLLVEALRRSYQASRQVASFAVMVDAMDENTQSFYERFGFIRFPTIIYRLFLPMKTVESLFRS